jgi:hypothetical protein
MNISQLTKNIAWRLTYPELVDQLLLARVALPSWFVQVQDF